MGLSKMYEAKKKDDAAKDYTRTLSEIRLSSVSAPLEGGSPGSSPKATTSKKRLFKARARTFDHPGTAVVDNPVPQKRTVTDDTWSTRTAGDLVVIVMVGLPATGKTYIGRRLKQYLRFFHDCRTEIFNVGNYRRKVFGAETPHTFFSQHDEEAMAKRMKCAQMAMEDCKTWLRKEDSRPSVAVFDATNTTVSRRAWIMEQLDGVVESSKNVVFVESICDDDSIVDANIRAVKLKMPDYKSLSDKDAVQDFKQRINHYKEVYEPMCDKRDANLSFVKLKNGGRGVEMNCVRGYLQGRILHFLINLHTTPRPLYFSRHGQSQYNVLGKIGGDSFLSPQGEAYAVELAKFAHEEILGLDPDGTFKDENTCTASHARLYTSSLRRTKQTARHIKHPVCADGWVCMRPVEWRGLDEIFAGDFDGMTYEEIKEQFPHEFAARAKDKLRYTYPRGESYIDVIKRLDPVIHELERQTDPLLLVGHQGILRILFAYFMGLTREEAPFLKIPLNHVIKLSPETYSCEEERIELLRVDSELSDNDAPSH